MTYISIFFPYFYRLYWINNGDLVSMKPDGSEPKYHAYVGYATHIAIYQVNMDILLID